MGIVQNYRCDYLEVKNSSDRVVLQVQVLPDRIRIQGEWYDDYGKGVRVLKTNPPLPHRGAHSLDLRLTQG
jgi:hypothetical protein